MKIAIVKLSALGDIVHAMVVLQFIKKYNQKIEIDWIIEACYKDLLDFKPDISKVHTVNFKKIKQVISRLTSGNYSYQRGLVIITTLKLENKLKWRLKKLFI